MVVDGYDDHERDVLSSGVDTDLSDEDEGTKSPVDRGEAKTRDSIGGFLKTMRTKPKNWIDQAFG